MKIKPASRKYGGFIAFFDHLPDGEPCLCLGSRTARDRIPGFIMPNEVKSKRSAFVIPLKMAYLYADSQTGGPSHYMMQRAFLIAKHLGLDGEKSTIKSIVDAVLDNLADLVAMPPLDTTLSMAQIEKKAEQHGLIAKLDGKTIIDAS
jgi:hypothetical protein